MLIISGGGFLLSLIAIILMGKGYHDQDTLAWLVIPHMLALGALLATISLLGYFLI